MKRAFTLIEVMVVLSILAIIAILAYNFFGSTMKEATVTQMATAIYLDMNKIELAYEEYIRKTGDKPDLSDDTKRTAFKDAVVDMGILREWPTPNIDWRETTGGCGTSRSPGGALGWNLAYTDYAGSLDPDFFYSLFCVRDDVCTRFNELYPGLPDTTTSHVDAEFHGGRLCNSLSGNPALVFGLGEVN